MRRERRSKERGRGIEGSRARTRLFSRVFVLVTLSTFAYFLSMGALVPTLPRYVEAVLGAGDAAVGVVVGSFGVAALAVRPLVGRSGDRRGRRLLIVGGAALVSLSIAGYAAARGLIALLPLRLLTGVGDAAFYVGAASVINDLAPDERRGEAISYFSLALYGGMALGPVVGEAIFDTAGFPAVCLVAAASAAAAAALGLPVSETRLAVEDTAVSDRLVHPEALRPGIVMACSVCGLAGFNTFVPLYALQVGLRGSRAVFFTYSAVIMLIRSVGARLPDRLGPTRAALTALASTAGALWLIAAWAEPLGLYTGTLLFGVGQALAFPALMTMAVDRAPASERGAVVGTFTAFFDLAFGGGSIALGAVAQLLGYRGVFAAGGLVSAGGAALVVSRARRTSPQPDS